MEEIYYYGNNEITSDMFNDIFNNYFKIIKNYNILYAHSNKKDTDVPYFYNERANVGLFTGSIWRSSRKSLVLEEYILHKTELKRVGRRDIWFALSDPQNKEELIQYRCEAKQFWLKLHKENKHKSKVLRIVNTSMNELKNVETKNGFRVGISFIVIKVNKKQWNNYPQLVKSYDESFDSCLKENSEIYPEFKYILGRFRDDLLTNDHFEGKNCVYPGIDVLLSIGSCS